MTLLQQMLATSTKHVNAFEADKQACMNELTALQNGWKDYAEMKAKCPEVRVWQVTEESTINLVTYNNTGFKLTITHLEDEDFNSDEAHFYFSPTDKQGNYTVDF